MNMSHSKRIPNRKSKNKGKSYKNYCESQKNQRKHSFNSWVGCVVSFGMETDGGVVVVVVAVAVVLAVAAVITGQLVQQFFAQVLQ